VRRPVPIQISLPCAVRSKRRLGRFSASTTATNSRYLSSTRPMLELIPLRGRVHDAPESLSVVRTRPDGAARESDGVAEAPEVPALFALHRHREALHPRVAVAIAAPAQAARDPMAHESGVVILAGVRAALVGVMQPLGGGTSARQRHLQGSQREMPIIHRADRIPVIEHQTHRLDSKPLPELSPGSPAACWLCHSGHRIHLSERVYRIGSTAGRPVIRGRAQTGIAAFAN